ncbi:hypothetical protein [Spiroplasma endosymbiont of Nebria brevicollis]|uniref:hypothetical protein n=1 Tax=Spiroplasma endosymbiont of Nebria brevicollis TaxID=3066284 RepID=UPI00313D9E9D
MSNNKKLQIIKWNIYNARVNFLEIKGSKVRPIIAVHIIPLTTNLENRTKYDIDININNKQGIIKVGNLQRIYEGNIISPLYSKDILVPE